MFRCRGWWEGERSEPAAASADGGAVTVREAEGPKPARPADAIACGVTRGRSEQTTGSATLVLVLWSPDPVFLQLWWIRRRDSNRMWHLAFASVVRHSLCCRTAS